MTVARGAINIEGTPTAAMVTAAMGTVKTIPASMRRLVSIGSSLIMLTALVIMSLSSTYVTISGGGLLFHKTLL